MEEQVTPEQFIIVLLALAAGGVLSAIYWYWQFGTGTVAWVGVIVKYFRQRAQKAPRVMSRSDTTAIPVSPTIPPVSDTGISRDTGAIAGNLTEREILIVLAMARNARGKYIYSGKKIYALVGGNYNDFVATMKQLRGEERDLLPDEPSVFTPIAQRPTNASYYPNNPELEYRAPH
jgi:hypothetical protein